MAEVEPKEKEKFVVQIRPLQEEDIAALREILEHWLQDDGVVAQSEVEEDIETLRESLQSDSNKHMLVAQTADGRVVGMMGLSERPKPPLLRYVKTDNPGELIIAYVHPEFRRGKGVGTALINAVQALALSKEKKEILLESGPRNVETGYPFYDRQPGFRRRGVLRNFYGAGAHSMVWGKSF